jgi:hypothetical protein
LRMLSKNQIGDEYHYIFECTNLSEKRTSLLPKHLIERPNILKFKNLMTCELMIYAAFFRHRFNYVKFIIIIFISQTDSA